MPFEPDKITREHVLAAVKRIDEEEIELKPSTGYDVVINGETYPPKEVMRYAHQIANGEFIWTPVGGPPTNKYLTALGFGIVDKRGSSFESAVIINSQQRIWKLGCNWGSGAPSFYEFIKSESIVIGKSEMTYSFGDLIAIAEGHRILAIAKVTSIPRPVTENETYQLSFREYQIDYRPDVNYATSEWYVLPQELQFLYQLQQGICEIQLAGTRKKIIDLWGGRHTKSFTNKLSSMHSKNIILYGPPGTGKTFNTINKAVSIVNPLFEISNTNREEIKKEFTRLQNAGQIEFVTFHQSMSYEDFVEGIKPDVIDGELIYEVKEGIFKRIAKKAYDNWMDAKQGNAQNLSFEDAFNKLKEIWEEQPDLKFKMKTEGKEFTVTGFTTSSIKFKKASGGTGHTLSISTLREYYYSNRDIKSTGVGVYYPGVLDKLKSFQPEKQIKKEEKQYVLIIDEINRGNISQIFGELITLIEDDKRLGEKEALSVTLPYSKEKFIVPPNLYIIGTMNTADRSVEALDTALRRRFMFEQILPEEDLLSSQKLITRLFLKYTSAEWNDEDFRREATELYNLIGIDDSFEKDIRQDENPKFADDDKILKLDDNSFSGVNLKILLSVINKRLASLLSKDNTIGHAWLMNVYSLANLQSAFANKIIPLLQEFFYNDYAKIGLVLGKNFVGVVSSKETPFASFDEELAAEYSEKPMYALKDPFKLGIKDFQSIYQ